MLRRPRVSPLIFANTAHTLSIIAIPQQAVTAAREIRKAKADHHADAGQRARLGQVGDEAMIAEYDEVVAREKELAAGHAILDFTSLLTVSARDSDELEAACAAMELAAGQAGCEIRRLFAQQAQAFIAAALPLGRRIT